MVFQASKFTSVIATIDADNDEVIRPENKRKILYKKNIDNEIKLYGQAQLSNYIISVIRK